MRATLRHGELLPTTDFLTKFDRVIVCTSLMMAATWVQVMYAQPCCTSIICEGESVGCWHMWIGSDFHRDDPVRSKAAAAAMWAAVPGRLKADGTTMADW